MPEVTAAPVPPLEPPAERFRSRGLRVVSKRKLVVLTSWANSGVLVLPSRTAPAAFIRSTAMASSSGTKCSRIREPNVVLSPRVWRLSLATNGTPSRARAGAPDASLAHRPAPVRPMRLLIGASSRAWNVKHHGKKSAIEKPPAPLFGKPSVNSLLQTFGIAQVVRVAVYVAVGDLLEDLPRGRQRRARHLRFASPEP